MSVSFNYSALRGFITEHYGSIKNYADFLGIGSTAMYDRLAGRVPFSQEEIAKTAIRWKLSAKDVNRIFLTMKYGKPYRDEGR